MKLSGLSPLRRRGEGLRVAIGREEEFVQRFTKWGHSLWWQVAEWGPDRSTPCSTSSYARTPFCHAGREIWQNAPATAAVSKTPPHPQPPPLRGHGRQNAHSFNRTVNEKPPRKATVRYREKPRPRGRAWRA